MWANYGEHLYLAGNKKHILECEKRFTWEEVGVFIFSINVLN